MKKLFLFFAFAISALLTAQNITFVYELKYKPNISKDSIVTDEYYLDVLGRQSVFRSSQARRSDSLTEKTGFGAGEKMTFTQQLYIKKNLVSKSIIKVITAPVMNDKYFIRISDNLEWEIGSDKLKIGEYDCQKATVNYAGREWTAWFTQSIPLQEGPYIFSGLPGMIVKISDRHSDYEFALIKTKKSDKNNMFALRTGKEINWEVFNKMQLNYYSDPFAEIKTRNIKFQVGDANGNRIPMDMNTLTKNIQKQIKEINNPIELNHKIEYE